ncbi:histidine kinase dimerization/phospho-acceptor domain-containing protein [Peptococcaceae bacterium 1198_IL3148]
MDIKLKNKLIIGAWLLLFTFGLSGLLTALSSQSEYFNASYFETHYFESDYQRFITYLGMFEINYLPKEQVKERIEVTPEEIKEHRYRYGDLATQREDITAQYQPEIDAALQAQNQELADIYIAERDAKIADITENFKSDEHVKQKVIKEKEQQIDEYYKELEKIRPEYNRLKIQFKYHLKDTDNNQLYTNLAASEKDLLSKGNAKDILYSRSYSDRHGYLSVGNNYLGYDQLMQPLIGDSERMLTGTIVVPKSAPAAGAVMANYHDFQQRQKLFFIQLSCAVVALLLSLYLYKKKTIIVPTDITEKWQQYYNRLPIDVCIAGLLGFSLIALMRLQYSYAFYLYNNLYTYIVNILLDLIVTAIFVTLTVIQAKLLYDRVKGSPNSSALWQTTLTYRIYQWMREAFLIRSIGTQVLLILAVVFGFGGGAAAVLVEPKIIIIYAPAFIVIGLPLFILIIKRAGYFNRIVVSTNQLAQGNLEPDLPVTGKSPLAVLAGNINKLKYGVKTSKIEQAKSERLKTELITNVSHDLRTPLTSIITYTELLKKPEIAEEDRQAYIEIIDRKSKRLKVLIDDLFEASKMASGSIELVKEKVDLVQLLQQALAEHNEKTSASSLQFRVTMPEHPVYVTVDGQKMWRVYDNLIANILKYAMENTRVYITMTVAPDKVIIIFKNITKYELGDDVNELFERCKRGDKSRQTEGSGLGLAIAKSIVDLHNGSLEIDVDGDLFKITITLPRD